MDASFVTEPVNIHAIVCLVCQAVTFKVKDFLAGLHVF